MNKIESKKSIESIDFFKGIAILMVVLVHSVQRFWVPQWFGLIPSVGQLGCQIFFVLSSFSLCVTYSDTKINYLSFIKRRLSKLSIGYWTMIVFYSLLNSYFAFRDGENIIRSINVPGIILNFLFLHGFSFDKGIVNGIVRGGWFVGTVTVLYLLFPLLLKIFNYSKPGWKKHKTVLFPLISFVLSLSFFAVCKFINKDFLFENNSVAYFSFINQLPCFAMGFSLYEIYKYNFFSKINYCTLKLIFFSLITLFIFLGGIKNIFILISFFVSLTFIYMYSSLQNNKKLLIKINSDSNAIVRIIKKCGKFSFLIYLTHPIIVHLLMKRLITYLREIYYNDMFWYIIFCPVMFIASYFLAVLFQKYVSFVRNVLDQTRNKIISLSNKK